MWIGWWFIVVPRGTITYIFCVCDLFSLCLFYFIVSSNVKISSIVEELGTKTLGSVTVRFGTSRYATRVHDATITVAQHGHVSIE